MFPAKFKTSKFCKHPKEKGSGPVRSLLLASKTIASFNRPNSYGRHPLSELLRRRTSERPDKAREMPRGMGPPASGPKLSGSRVTKSLLLRKRKSIPRAKTSGGTEPVNELNRMSRYERPIPRMENGNGPENLLLLMSSSYR
ncbi:3-dehydroquinate synthase [Striga asiatica]|uniref:3-dehydroquinate synthase n=1 Tax=Striga asiatica TaxID=4170 RepID=A0A5A7PBS4_STRAF|nr:3-dehydroquinate synthase [Striga asiatica]